MVGVGCGSGCDGWTGGTGSELGTSEDGSVRDGCVDCDSGGVGDGNGGTGEEEGGGSGGEVAEGCDDSG